MQRLGCVVAISVLVAVSFTSALAQPVEKVAEKFTATLFAGIGCTYGDSRSCSDSENQFPAAGAGVQYRLKPKEGIVLNLEYAQGKADNYGVYLKMGYAY